MASAPALSVDGLAAAIAFDVHLQDGGVMDETIDGRECHGLFGEDFAPIAERLVNCDQHGSPFVTRG